MTADFLLAAVHHIVLLLLVSVLGGQAALLRQAPSATVLQWLGKLDAFYGVSAVALLVIGSMRLSMGAKDISFYSGNPVFWAKIALFVLIGLLSILPTVRFIQWRKAHTGDGALPSAEQWARVRKLVWAQLHLLPFVAIAAAAMARGIGH